VISNGHSQRAQSLLDALPEKWVSKKSFKTSNQQTHFYPFNMAPIDDPDFKDSKFDKGCWITEHCGIALTPLGYFPCAVSGGIERVMKIQSQSRSMPKRLNQLADLLPLYCRFCGHYKSDEYTSREKRTNSDYQPQEQSESWDKAYMGA